MIVSNVAASNTSNNATLVTAWALIEMVAVLGGMKIGHGHECRGRKVLLPVMLI